MFALDRFICKTYIHIFHEFPLVVLPLRLFTKVRRCPHASAAGEVSRAVEQEVEARVGPGVEDAEAGLRVLNELSRAV